MKKSEFGKGFVYCLGLFLCHTMQNHYLSEERKKDDTYIEMWFYGAADHFYEIEIPEQLPQKMKIRLINFVDKVIAWRLPIGRVNVPTKEDKEWAINEAKDILLEVDKKYFIKDAIKGDYE